MFHIVTGSYDIPAAHVVTDGYYTNKAPGGVAYRCSFRVTEASYLIERLSTTPRTSLGVDAAQFRLDNFIQPDQFPYESATGLYDSGNYPEAMRIALEKLGYEQLRAEQEAARAEGRLLGIRARLIGPRRRQGEGLRPRRPAHVRLGELRVHPTGKAILKLGVRTQGQGTRRPSPRSWPASSASRTTNIEVQEGDTDRPPTGSARTRAARPPSPGRRRR